MSPPRRTTTAAGPHALADGLSDLVVEHVDAFVGRHAPDFRLPSVFAGYPVGADVRADLAFTLAHLRDLAVTTVAGVGIDDAIRTVLKPIDGAQTHTFSSYRVAETLRRFGPLRDNALLADLEPGRRAELADATDSTSWVGLLDDGLPANYAAVLARCELARRDLGLDVDPGLLDQLLTRTRRMLEANPKGYLDDSEGGGGARYDIYTADVYLFTEPFADQLEPAWTAGAGHVVDLVAKVAGRDGSAVTWGRSLGCLAHCHTVELAAVALERGLTDEGGAWLERARRAMASFRASTDGMLVDAHRHRGQNRYRGPDRWLQLTFDCLGKLAWAAGRLRRAPGADGPVEPAEAYPPRDELIALDERTTAAVWTFRSPATAFVVPFVGTAWADYLPAPRNPTLYEVPVDAPLPCAVPVVTAGTTRFVSGGLPRRIRHEDARVDAEWDGFAPLVPTDATPVLAGRRATRFHVDGHVLRVRETLHFDVPPDAVSLQVTEARGRPLRVEAVAAAGCRVDVVDTDGLPAYRSFWSELPAVHQIDVEPAAHIELEWSVRPRLRVATADPSHHYHRSLYDDLAADVVETSFGAHLIARPDTARRQLADVDVFHLHWPEWFVDTPEQAEQFVDLLADTDTMLLWTQHNLRPHREVARADELYQVFAGAADVVVHHSEWGRTAVTDRYRFRADARHAVVPHGHFGALIEASAAERSAGERELGLSPCSVRIAIVGAPRRDKRVQEFLDAFAATSRDDVQLVVLSLSGERVPDDPRIVARPYEFVSRAAYDRQLAVADVLALPFDPDGSMLTTGVVGDVVGLGVPAIVSDWPYLTETLGAAGLVYRTPDGLTALIESLDDALLAPARDAARALQADLAWDHLAPQLFDLLVAAGAFKG